MIPLALIRMAFTPQVLRLCPYAAHLEHVLATKYLVRYRRLELDEKYRGTFSEDSAIFARDGKKDHRGAPETLVQKGRPMSAKVVCY